MVKVIFFLLRFICLTILIIVGVFILLNLSPIDPIKAYIGNDLLHVPPEQYMHIVAKWGGDKPLWFRFSAWFRQVLQGDLGYSMLYNSSVADVIWSRLGPSLALLLGAWFFAGILGIIFGLVAGRFLNRWPDKLISTLAYLIASIPTFWIGLLFISLFAVKLNWSPICCAWPIGETSESATVVQKINHLILPLVTLGLIGIGNIVLHTRAKVAETMNSDFIYYAKAQGDSGWGMMLFHVIKHAITPAICLQFASLGELISGSLLVEKVFAYPGLGQAVIDACFKGDIPLLMGIVLCCAIIIFLSNSIAEKLLQKMNKGLIATL